MFSTIILLLVIAGVVYYFKNKSKVATQVEIVKTAVKETANTITKQ
jgi:hypothetical protein